MADIKDQLSDIITNKGSEKIKKEDMEVLMYGIIDTIEENHLPQWKRLCFNQLNCDEMIEISLYIKKTFSVEGRYSHLLPKLQIYNGFLCLNVDVSQINDKIKL